MISPEPVRRLSAPCFEEIWAEASALKGWFSRGEAAALYRLACGVPPGLCIVEIGSYCGRATVVLASSGCEVVAVDPLVLGTAPTGRWQVTPEHIDDFERVVRTHPNVTWRRVRSLGCPEPERGVGLLLIDGEHDYPHPREDYEHFEPWLAPGAVVAFHDYRVCHGVTHTVEELTREGRIERTGRRERLFVAHRAAREAGRG